MPWWWRSGRPRGRQRPSRDAVLAFSPAPYNYGQVAAGQAASQTFTLANTGGQATGRLRVTLTGAAAFTLTGETCHSLGPGKRCTVTVRFAPAGAGTVTATLTAAGISKRAAATGALTGAGAVGAPPPSHLYWAAGDSIWEANLDGSSAQAIVTGQISPFGVAVGSLLYWTDAGNGTINGANLDGSNPGALVTGQHNPNGVAVGASHLYWANNGDGTIWEANLDGGSPHAIATGQHDPLGVAVGPN